MPTDDHDIPQLDTLDAVLDALDSPSTLETFRATKAWDADMVAAAAARRALNSGDEGGGSQAVLSATVTVTSAQLKALVATPKTIVAAVPGSIIMPIQLVSIVSAGTPYTGAQTIALGWGDSGAVSNWPGGLGGALADGGAVDVALDTVLFSPTAENATFGFLVGASDLTNQPLQLQNPDTDMTVGDLTATLTLLYSLVAVT